MRMRVFTPVELRAAAEAVAAIDRREVLTNDALTDDAPMNVCVAQNGATPLMLGTFLTIERTAMLVAKGYLRPISQTEFDNLAEGTRLYSHYEYDEGEGDKNVEQEPNEWPAATYACLKYVEKGRREEADEKGKWYIDKFISCII